MKISILLLILHDGWHCILDHSIVSCIPKMLCKVFANIGVNSQIGMTAFKNRSQQCFTKE